MPALTPLEQFLQPYPDDVQRTMLEGNAILREMLQPVNEMVYDATSAVGAGFSYTGDLKGLFVNLAAYSKHVTLVFGRGKFLDDPLKRLKGEGSQVRHVRLASVEDLRDPYISGLIRQASEAAPRPVGPVIPTVVVKVYNGPKRRPRPE